MTWWLVRGLRRGVVTTRYPRSPEPSAASLPAPPVIRADLVDDRAAEALATVCPSRALSRTTDALVYDVGRCTACGRCLDVAGGAIRPGHGVELAVRDRDLLVQRIPIRRRPT